MSLCIRVGCPVPRITFEEWDRNDGCCDACADLKPSLYFSFRSNDYIQQGAIDAADERWQAAQANAA